MLSLKHVCFIKHAEHGAAICAQCDTRSEGLHIGLAAASICMEERDGNTPLRQGARRGQLDLIALREHVCWSRPVEPLWRGPAICLPEPQSLRTGTGLVKEATTLSKDTISAHG